MPISFSEVPFLRFFLAFTIGLVLYNYGSESLGFNSTTLLIGGGFLILVASIFHNYLSWLSGILLIFLLVILGYSRSQLVDQMEWESHFTQLKCSDQQYLLTGEICGLKERESGVTLILEVTSTACASDWTQIDNTVSGKINIVVRDSTIQNSFLPGQTIQFKGKVNEVTPPRNPGSFSYKKYLSRKRIYHQSFSKPDAIKILPNAGWNPNLYLHQFREKFIANLREATQNKNSPGMILGIVLGDKTSLDKEINSNFRDVGAAHVLAVSGLHVGIVYSLLFFIFGKFNTYLKSAIILFGVWGFVVFAGMPPSAIRAATMFTLLSVGQFINKRAHALNILAFCAFLHLFIEPKLLTDIGFQFSYLALAGIIVFYNKVSSAIPCPIKVLTPFRDLISLSVAAQLGVLPLSIYYFNQASPYFMLSSIFSVIGAYFILTGGLLTGLMGFISPTIASWIGTIMDICCSWLAFIMQFFNQLPFAAIREIFMSFSILFLLYALIIMLAFVWYRRITHWIQPAILIVFTIISIGFTNKYNYSTTHSAYIYSMGKEVLVDVFSTGKIDIFHSPDLTETSEYFAASDNRMKRLTSRRIINRHTIAKKTSSFRAKGQFSDLLILSNGVPPEHDLIINRPTHLVFTHLFRTEEELEYLLQHENILSITAGGAISRKVAEHLKHQSDEAGIPFYNTYNHYHFIKNF